MEVKEHLWFKDFDWKGLYLYRLKAPFIPRQGDNFDHRYCNAPDKSGVNTLERYKNIMGSTKYKEAFIDFNYFNRFYKNMNNNNFENKKEFKNPHLIYLEEDSKENNNESNNDKNNKNFDDIRSFNNLFLIGNEHYKLRKLPSSNSSYTLLKGYHKNRPITGFSLGNYSTGQSSSGNSYSYNFFSNKAN